MTNTPTNCRKCGGERVLVKKGKKADGSQKYEARCKPCLANYQRKYYQDNPATQERQKARQKARYHSDDAFKGNHLGRYRLEAFENRVAYNDDLYNVELDVDEFTDEATFRDFLAALIRCEFDTFVMPELWYNDCQFRFDLFLPEYQAVIECKLDKHTWSKESVEEQLSRYRDGTPFEVFGCSPKGEYGLETPGELLKAIRNRFEHRTGATLRPAA